MKTTFALAAMLSFALVAVHAAGSCVVERVSEGHAKAAGQMSMAQVLRVAFGDRVTTINRVSAVVQLDQATIFIDPVGDQAQYRRFGRPDIVVLTSAHPEHLSIDTMIGMLRRDTVVLAPQVVIDQLPLMIANNVVTPFEAGMTQIADGVTFHALAAYSPIPKAAEVYPRVRGDIGVVIEMEGAAAYF